MDVQPRARAVRVEARTPAPHPAVSQGACCRGHRKEEREVLVTTSGAAAGDGPAVVPAPQGLPSNINGTPLCARPWLGLMGTGDMETSKTGNPQEARGPLGWTSRPTPCRWSDRAGRQGSRGSLEELCLELCRRMEGAMGWGGLAETAGPRPWRWGWAFGICG